MNLKGELALVVIIMTLLEAAPSVGAQQSEPTSASLEKTRAALQSSRQAINGNGASSLFARNKSDEFRLGSVTLLPPDTPGQFVSVRVPVGDLVSRAAHSFAVAQRRRAEKAANVEVVNALAQFQNAQPK